MIITIDGPSGTGKSTVAKRVAALLGFSFFDTGAMYRAVAWVLQNQNLSIDDDAAIKAVLSNFHFQIHDILGQKRYSVNNFDVTEAIRAPEISAKASAVAVLPRVRQAMASIQRDFARDADSVFEGRDMGTNVFPDAEIKIFLTARPEVRAERRFQELTAKKGAAANLTKEQVFRDLLERDERDTTRPIAPLRKPSDAREIDTSDLDVDQVVSIIMEYIAEQKKKSHETIS